MFWGNIGCWPPKLKITEDATLHATRTGRRSGPGHTSFRLSCNREPGEIENCNRGEVYCPPHNLPSSPCSSPYRRLCSTYTCSSVTLFLTSFHVYSSQPALLTKKILAFPPLVPSRIVAKTRKSFAPRIAGATSFRKQHTHMSAFS